MFTGYHLKPMKFLSLQVLQILSLGQSRPQFPTYLNHILTASLELFLFGMTLSFWGAPRGAVLKVSGS